MAYRRSLSTRASIIARRYHPSFSYVLHDDDNRKSRQYSDGDVPLQKVNDFLQTRSFGNGFNKSAGFSSHGRRHPNNFLLSTAGPCFYRYMSSAIGEGSSKIELIGDVAEVFSDATVQSAAFPASTLSEVAIAAADSYLPVKGLQYFIDAVHSFTGLDWWAAIVLSTLIVRTATIPLVINQLKSTAKLTLLRPHLEEVRQRIEDKAMDPQAVAEGQREMKKLFKEYGVTPFTPMKGIFIQGPLFISFFFAISKMTEKMPSFKEGGALWFVDLTTQDSLYIFPVLTALSFWLTVEFNMQEGMEGNPIAVTMKNFLRVVAVATVPLTMSFPKAIFCYWLTSNTFSLMHGLVLKAPGVKKFLGVPEIPVAKPTAGTSPQHTFSSLFTQLKQAASPPRGPTPSTIEPPKLFPKRKSSSASAISQRLKSLEREVKGRKKNKRR